MRFLRARVVRPLAITALLAPALTACSLVGGDDSDDSGGGGTETVVLITHESFSLPEDLIEAFESEHDVTLEIRQPGDAGAMVTEIALNPDDSGADVVFGVDNTLASRLLDVGALVDFTGELAPGSEQYALDDPRLVPVDTGDVCVNVDTAWFAEQGIPEPETFDDLIDPAYADLFVTPGPVDSSPGLAFLLATIAEFGEDGWQDYWTDLRGNGAEIVAGWSDAYYTSFTAGGEGGQRPIVLSYASSPAFTVNEDSTATTTRALLDTCFAQTEFAGVLAGADAPEAAQELVAWLQSEAVQAALPDQMYVYPVRDDVALPQAWEEFAPLPQQARSLPADDISANREDWIAQWRDLIE